MGKKHKKKESKMPLWLYRWGTLIYPESYTGMCTIAVMMGVCCLGGPVITALVYKLGAPGYVVDVGLWISGILTYLPIVYFLSFTVIGILYSILKDWNIVVQIISGLAALVIFGFCYFIYKSIII